MSLATLAVCKWNSAGENVPGLAMFPLGTADLPLSASVANDITTY
jgi:hypothetical protein